MGRISLLSKENEVELARQIERAEMGLITAVLKTDLSLEVVEFLYQEIKTIRRRSAAGLICPKMTTVRPASTERRSRH